ncbi:MAG TPA: allantoinase AllB [Gaiellaceae bacterium]|nr:allantoinase AllB [Gaiellaceae bacterium]
MPDADLLIRGAEPADVAIADGLVVAVGRELGLTAAKTVDATGLRVLAGAVDAHVHFNDPGRADWEGWATGTAAAAAGGTTCVIDMPLNAHPPTLDADSFRRKLAAAEASAVVDFAFWGGLVPGNVERLAELADAGVVGFKAFMCPSGIDDFEAADERTLREGMAEAARLGLPVAVHAESAAITEDLAAAAAGRGWRDYAATRPIEAELEAIAQAIVLAEETGCSLHVVHVSTGRGVRLVTAARVRGVDVTCETCPHYLVLDRDDLEALGAVAKCAPPLRPRAERDDLRAELAAGSIDLVASDHSPSPPSLKEGDDAFAVWGGISGCQSLLALALTEGVPLELVTERPAARFRLPGKGRLVPGADADLVLVDPSAETVLRAGDLRYRHRHSPYVGRRLRGRVAGTWLRGRPVVAGEPRGRLVRPSAAG